MKTFIIFTTSLLMSTLAMAGGTLGGNPSADSGAVNIGIGKCVQYQLTVKATQQAGGDVSTIVVPEGCETK